MSNSKQILKHDPSSLSKQITNSLEAESQQTLGSSQKTSNYGGFQAIPSELKDLIQWITWKLEIKSGGIYTKRPYIAGLAQIPRNRASVSDPSTWRDFETAWKSIDNKSGGIGFIFTDCDPYCFIDLDHCIDENGIIEPKSKQIIDKLNSYTEKSQSGLGIHIIVKAGLPEGSGNRKGNFEIYDKGRYACMTGNVLQDYPVIIEERQEQVNQICSEIFGKPEPVQKPSRQEPSTSNLSDQEIIEKASKAKNADKFNRLIAGQWQGEYPSQSEADLALCCGLAFWTPDADQIDRLFRQSGLYRGKWDRADYRNDTINKALELTPEHYTPGGNHTNIDKSNKAGDPVVAEPEQKPIKAFNLTDYGNAERLVYFHGENIRYCEPMKSWFIWDGKRWKPDDCLEIERLAKDTVRRIYTEAGYCDNENQRKAIADHAKRSEANNKIQAMVALTRSESNVIIRPDSLDRDGLLLNCENGTIDLRTGELLPHRKEDNITKIIPVNYDKMAEYPRWEQFLNEIFSGDQELIRFIKYSMGYSLTNSINEQCFFICHGTGANGKSVFLDTVELILGDYGRRVNPTTFEDIHRSAGPREDIAGLKQIRYISTIETGQGRRLAENLLKQMTGDSTIRARFLYQNSTEFEQTYKIWIATNHKPIIRGTDEGIWRRVRLIPFEFTIEPEKQNKNLRDELREEAPGILQWAIEGCLTWIGTGLHCVTPEKVRTATNDYRTQMDTVGTFIKECCEKGTNKMVKVTDLYNAYCLWSADKISRKEFNVNIEDLGYKKERITSGLVWLNIRLTEDDLFKSG